MHATGSVTIVGLFYYIDNYANLADFEAALPWKNICTANELSIQGVKDLLSIE